MKDRDFLIWIHKRLVHIHNEDESVDYMHRLRQVIYFAQRELKRLEKLGA